MIQNPKGLVYRCPVCGAEVLVLAKEIGKFTPRCCGVSMLPTEKRVIFYVCPVCGSEIAVLKQGGSGFRPRCCNVDMERFAA